MPNYDIAITGMSVAQQALELVGTNIANAATEGYHRQDLRIAPKYLHGGAHGSVGAGAEISEVRRSMDVLLEEELTRLNPQWGQADQERITLQSIESMLGDMESQGLTRGMEDFFAALHELSAHTESRAYQEQALWAASGLAGHFRNTARSLADTRANVFAGAENLATQINALTARIADLNTQIQQVAARGSNTNVLLDSRDQAILDLSEFIEIEVTGRGSNKGIFGITAWGMPLVSEQTAYTIGIGSTSTGEIGVSLGGANYYTTAASGGRLGAALSLQNELIPAIQNQLDAAAAYVIREVNRLQVQGVGTHGAFTELDGWVVSDQPFASWDPHITDGSVFVRVTDTVTGAVTRTEIALTTASTVGDLRAAMTAVPHLNASIVAGALHIEAAPGYEFDFLPSLLPEPTASTLGVGVDVSGLYRGEQNEIFTCTVTGSPGLQMVGSATGLYLEVHNNAGELVRTINIGLGYAPGDRIEISEGVYLTLEAGMVQAGEALEVQALASSDTTGVLAAVGINALFRGTSAATMGITSEVQKDSSRIATSRGAEMSDNVNILRMAAVADQRTAELGGTTPLDYQRQIITGVGQSVATRQARAESLETVVQQVLTSRENVSGVDINEEAAKLLMFEHMFHAIAKFVSAQDKVMQTLFQLL